MHQPSAQTNLDNAEALARAYIDVLAQADGVKTRSMLRSRTSGDDAIEALLSSLEVDPDQDSPHMRVDLVAAAILVARAISAEPGLARRFRHEGPVVIIKTHISDLVQQVHDVINECVTTPGSSRKLVLSRDGSDRTHTPGQGNKDVLYALNRRVPVVGIAPSPAKQLPNALTRMAQHELSLAPVDDWAMRLILEATTGVVYQGEIDPELIRNADITDLCLAFHRDFTPGQCLERLADLIVKKKAVDFDGPTLEQLDGYGPAKQWGLELISDIASLRAGTLNWSDFDHVGLLLSGPPGVGKTSFAKALAKSARVPLVATSVADWNASTYLSGTLQAIRDVFGRAKRAAPCILFIDELDGISNRAALSGDYVEYWTQIVNLVLECLAGVEDREGVVVLAASNHPDKIDPAILRAGRLDQHIALQKPDVVTLEKIFRLHIGADMPSDADILPAALAARGGTGADVEAWVRRGKAVARRAGRDLNVEDLLSQARGDRRPMSAQGRHRVAVHECGHVLVGLALGIGPLLGVAIRDNGGLAEFDVAFDGTTTEKGMERHICLALAGRAAEQLLLKDMGIGSGNGGDSDLAHATQMARLMETQYGLGSFGPVYIGDDLAGRLSFDSRTLDAVRKRLEAAQSRATEILAGQRQALTRLADELDSRGYMSNDEVEAVIAEVSSPSASSKEAAE